MGGSFEKLLQMPPLTTRTTYENKGNWSAQRGTKRPWQENGPIGPPNKRQSLGPMTRKPVSSEEVLGTMESWKGMFGWIRPAEPVEGTRADGLIYASVSDVKDMRCMLENAAVRFNVYTDEKGIGAQNVLPHGAEDDGSEPQENGSQNFNPMEILALFGKGKSGKGKMPWSK